ncbi:hypothetical protein [Pseudoalteromonas prydzensis]|uniref:hypothetical protein n=1 Tax=Pseudoalteromonas prydzensis TaxID=182141 RepID=UPI0007E51C12|nr:hypothetical protein [Pseudoalteromonas prydzensis]MBE0380407.1 hypothetical protein [Pseudoalteromonas prydzensis ACAM 620]
MKFLLLLCLLSSFYLESASWKDSPYVEVNKLYPFDDGLAFYTSYKDDNVALCDGGKRFYLPLTDKNYEVKASALLAAFMAKKKILIRYDLEQPKSCAAVVNRFLVAD